MSSADGVERIISLKPHAEFAGSVVLHLPIAPLRATMG
jgi:hypothetical protein